MKTERRHELETNTLAAALGRGIERVKPYSEAGVGILFAAALIFGVTLYLSSRARTQEEEGWDQYFEAMGENGTDTLVDVAEQFRGTPAGAWARLRVADVQFFRGSELLFRNRAEGNDQLRRAVDNYQAVLDQAESDMLQQRARFGLGQAHESLNELEKASAAYHALADFYPDSALRLLADRRLEDLEKQSTKQFYDWFASQDPGPVFEPDSGAMPDFDLDSIKEPQDDQSSGILDPTRSPPPSPVANGDEPPADETAGEPTGSEEPTSEGNSPDASDPSSEDSSASDPSGPSLSPAAGESEPPQEGESPP